MSKKGTSTYPLPDGCTEAEALSALAREAKRRNTSYGLLVVNTTEWERAEIIWEYHLEKRKKGRQTEK